MSWSGSDYLETKVLYNLKDVSSVRPWLSRAHSLRSKVYCVRGSEYAQMCSVKSNVFIFSLKTSQKYGTANTDIIICCYVLIEWLKNAEQFAGEYNIVKRN